MPTGFQRAPFFEVQTDRFALIAVDTGVLRKVDDAERRWLEDALDRSAGSSRWRYWAIRSSPADTTLRRTMSHSAVSRQLERRGVPIVMAGDTHDLEYYAEPGDCGTRRYPSLRQRRRRRVPELRYRRWPGPRTLRSKRGRTTPNRESVAMKIER